MHGAVIYQSYQSHRSSAASGSVINQFNLDRLSGFEWAQKQAEMDQLTACSEANATECVVDQQVRRVGVISVAALSTVISKEVPH